jgi:hypothetical protein
MRRDNASLRLASAPARRHVAAMKNKLPAHAEGIANVAKAPKVPAPPVKDHSRDAEQLDADQQAREREHNAGVLRLAGINPDKLTHAQIKKAAGLVAQVTRNHCAPGANARRPKARAELDAFMAAHPDARLKTK